MTSRRSLRGGFTLFEVLASVLILGVLYTVLADQAIRGLRSEGMDRRRAEAALIADLQLTDLETVLSAGAPLEPLREETEVDGYGVVIEILPEDVAAWMPPPEVDERRDRETEDLPGLLVDEEGKSRFFRLRVDVHWEEAGELQHVERRTWNLDRSVLAALFPPDLDDTPENSADLDPDGDGVEGDDSDSSRTSSSGSRSSGNRGGNRGSGNRGGGNGGGGGGGGGSAPEMTIQQMMEALQRARR